MKLEIYRDAMNADTVFIRITEMGMRQLLPKEFSEEAALAIKHFVQTDPELQILINEMTREAFKGIDLLKCVTEAVKQKVEASVAEVEPK